MRKLEEDVKDSLIIKPVKDFPNGEIIPLYLNPFLRKIMRKNWHATRKYIHIAISSLGN
jgi:hypothetical protein